MRYLGIDYGAKRIGIAISDEDLKLAFPLEVLENSPKNISELREICEANKVSKIIVGESKNFSQNENEIMKEIKPFTEKLQTELGIETVLHPEFLTSMEAERLQGHNDMHDASAAALILNSYLETENNKKHDNIN